MTDHSPVRIPDEPRNDVPDSVLYPQEYEGHFESLMITRSEILHRVKVLARLIHDDFEGERPVMVCVLKGANPFYQHLLDALQELKQGFTTEFLRASSYDGDKSSGRVKVSGGLQYGQLRNRHVILVEDIVDTGTTVAHLLPILQTEAHPKSIQVVTLLEKRLAEPPKMNAKYIGFSIPNHFVIGYGLDYNELYRDLQDIWVLSEAGIHFDQSKLYPMES